MVLRASERAAQLIREIAGGEPATRRSRPEHCRRRRPDFALRYARCNELFGVAVPPAEADRILEGFGLQKLGATDEQSSWRIPSYRSDLRREVDLIEEVVRVFGINRIPSASIAAGSRPSRPRIAATILKCSCGNDWSRAAFRKRAPRRWSAGKR